MLTFLLGVTKNILGYLAVQNTTVSNILCITSVFNSVLVKINEVILLTAMVGGTKSHVIRCT